MKQLLVLGLAVALAGCGISERLGLSRDRTAISLPYRAGLAVGEDQHDIAVAVTAPLTTTVDQVRESARYQATYHCLQNFGDSDADWQIDPATGDWAFVRTEETMIFNARCEGR